MTDYRPYIVLEKPSDILNYSYSSLSDEQRILYLEQQLIFNQNAQAVQDQIIADRNAETIIREEIRIQQNADSKEMSRISAALREATWGTPLYKNLRAEQIALGEKIRLRNEMLADARDLASLQNILNIKSSYVSPDMQIAIDLQAQANNMLENTIQHQQTVLELSQNTPYQTEPAYVAPNIPVYVETVQTPTNMDVPLSQTVIFDENNNEVPIETLLADPNAQVTLTNEFAETNEAAQPQAKDNTLLYVGAGILAVGAIMLMSGKKKNQPAMGAAAPRKRRKAVRKKK